MAVDKLVDSAQLESGLTDIADAIRAKTGGTADLQFPSDFVDAIDTIETGSGALYPLINGSHSFSNGCTITVTNGNHVKILNPHTSGGSGLINISDVTENTNTEQSITNLQNIPIKFTIPGGATAVFVIYNLVTPSNKVTSFNAYGVSTTLDIAIGDVKESGLATKTYSEDTDVACLFVAITQTSMQSLSFDVAFFVDGVRYV